MSSCFILAATPTRSTTYFVIPDDDEWKYLSIPTTSVQVVQSLALTTGQQQQMHAATLYRQQAGSSDVGTDLVCTDIIDGSNTTLDLSPIGGDARHIAMAFTSSAVSDLYVAGSKGIGYYAGQPLQGTVSQDQ